MFANPQRVHAPPAIDPAILRRQANERDFAAGARRYVPGNLLRVPINAEGPGQERHLPHEAWHVVQQRRGVVGPPQI